MKAVICGAGIGGLTLAWWLAKDDWDVVIVERSRGLRDEGYMLDFMGSGWDVAERMNLIPRLKELAYDIPTVRWIDESGKAKAVLDYHRFAGLLGGKLISIMRGDLERGLFEALPATVEMRFGQTIDALRTGDDATEVTLSDGTIMKADLVVGADGIHSHVREMVFGEESRFTRYLGYHTAAYIYEDAEAARRSATASRSWPCPAARSASIRCAAARSPPSMPMSPRTRRCPQTRLARFARSMAISAGWCRRA